MKDDSSTPPALTSLSEDDWHKQALNRFATLFRCCAQEGVSDDGRSG
jgi:hypothetical protein